MNLVKRGSDPAPPSTKNGRLSRNDIAEFITDQGWKLNSVEIVDDAPGRFNIVIQVSDGAASTEYEATLIVQPMIRGHGHTDVTRTIIWIGFADSLAVTTDFANRFNLQSHRSTAIVTTDGIVVSRVSHHVPSRLITEQSLIEDVGAIGRDALDLNLMHNAELKKLENGT